VLRQTRSTLLEAFSHADLPFEQIVAMAGGDRSVGSHPLYQTMFVLLEDEIPAIQLDQVEARSLAVETRTCKNDLLLSVQATGAIWSLRLEYSADLFSADGVSRMAGHLTELLRSITMDADCPVGRLNLMSPAERHQVLVEWNATARDYPRDRCIHQLFEEQVERTPEAVAVVFGEERLTYRELNARANRVARHLLLRGVRPSDVVGIRIERSLAMMVGLLGILKAGGAYWALEENLPEERWLLMLEDAKPRFLLVRKSSGEAMAVQVARIPSGKLPAGMLILAIEDLESAEEGIENLMSQSHAGEVAYVSYTSGSTGKPKGVMVPHRAVARLVKNTDFATLDAGETLLHLSPLSFDASTFEIWGGLLNGGRVVMMTPGPSSLADIGTAIREQSITTLWLTAGLFHLMVNERLDDLKPLRQLLAGGDVLSPDAVRKARQVLIGCRIINGYGPTENTTFTCCHEIVDDVPITGSVPIGRPITNTRVYILDMLLQPVPIGVTGELYAGGEGLACGYLNQPELTAERFTPDPFSPVPGAVLYRTGDQCRWLENGTIEFLGRLDHQVKIRGFRVEPGEIEAVFRKHPLVKDCVVMTRPFGQRETRFVGYMIPSGDDQCPENELRDFAGPYLPNYMIPNAFVWLDQLPLLVNGKLDRKRLPEPQPCCNLTTAESGKAKNLLEIELTHIWERLFQRSGIGRDDNFFDLGGHSIQAIRLITEIERILDQRHSISVLFESPTIASLARKLADEKSPTTLKCLVPLQPHGSKPPIFFMHGWGGGIYTYLDLAKLLPTDQPSYGIQALGLDGESDRHTSIKEMAAHYAETIIEFQPEGPYYLGGYSMAGLIAFEVAQELRFRGKRVALLALLDSAPLGPVPWPVHCRRLLPSLRERFRTHCRRWLVMPHRERGIYFRERLISLKRLGALNVSRQAPVAGPPEKSAQPPQVPGFSDYYEALAYSHPVRYYRGNVDVIFTEETGLTTVAIWKNLVRGKVSFHPVPGRHLEIITPDFMPALATALTDALLSAQRSNQRRVKWLKFENLKGTKG
jgi:aspartate racemase